MSGDGHDRDGQVTTAEDQPFSATAIESAIGVVGRPMRRERSPEETTSSPFSTDASTPARIAAKPSGSPAPVRMPTRASPETGLFAISLPVCPLSSAAYSAKLQAVSPPSSYVWFSWPSPVSTATAAAA